MACIVHCAVIGETHQGYHRHWAGNPHAEPAAAVAAHSPTVLNATDDYGLCESLLSQASDWTPSALTVGVVPGITFVLPLVVVVLQRTDHALQIRLVALPPPREPPRIAQ